jgi:hypothetical protein
MSKYFGFFRSAMDAQPASTRAFAVVALCSYKCQNTIYTAEKIQYPMPETDVNDWTIILHRFSSVSRAFIALDDDSDASGLPSKKSWIVSPLARRATPTDSLYLTRMRLSCC